MMIAGKTICPKFVSQFDLHLGIGICFYHHFRRNMRLGRGSGDKRRAREV